MCSNRLALQDADEASLVEPEQGYCVPGLSFSANELFAEIRKHAPGFETTVELDENMAKFANLWPDELSVAEPLRDLGYAPSVSLPEMVSQVLAAHEERNARTVAAFREVDLDGNGTLARRREQCRIPTIDFFPNPNFPKKVGRKIMKNIVEILPENESS